MTRTHLWETGPMASYRILVVEDEREIAAQIARRFESEGWTAREVHDGLEAVSEARDFLPDDQCREEVRCCSYGYRAYSFWPS